MKCFGHPEIDALGICKSCGKGLCGICFVDTGLGLACNGSCQKIVTTVTAQTAEFRGQSLIEATLCFLGSIVAIVGGIGMDAALSTKVGMVAVGIAMLFVGFWCYSRYRSAYKLRQTKPVALFQAVPGETESRLEQEFKKLEDAHKETDTPSSV